MENLFKFVSQNKSDNDNEFCGNVNTLFILLEFQQLIVIIINCNIQY